MIKMLHGKQKLYVYASTEMCLRAGTEPEDGTSQKQPTSPWHTFV